MADLTINERREGDVAVLALSGELDLAGLPAFESELARAETDAPQTLVLDLSAVEFMDSSGLRAIVMAHERASQSGRRFVVVAGPPQVRRVFEITQLDTRLELVDDSSAV